MSDTEDFKPPKVNKCKNGFLGCLKYLYDKNDNTVLGRTGLNWILLFIFYVVFYSFLAGFFALMMYIFMNLIIKPNQPYRTGDNSLLRALAGLNVYPRLSVDEALIIISTNKSDIYSTNYESAVNALFKKSFDAKSNNESTCLSNKDQPTDVSQFCKYDKNDLGPCIDPVGQMKQKKLCVFIRVNKVYGWLPDIINMTSSQDILVDCEGQNPGDTVSLRQPVYYPSFNDGTKSYGLLPNKYFPFISQKGYISPMVAIQFPYMKNNTAILVQCQIRNLKNSFGNVKFEIMLLDKKI